MELQRGICSLCAENTRVLISSDAEEFSKCLPNILYENFLPDSEFQKIKSLIKICALCCYKIQVAAETKTLLTNSGDKHTKAKEKVCHFCKTNKYVMNVGGKWKFFTDRMEGYLQPAECATCACPKCLFYFDIIFNFKTKLLYKFPQLVTQKKKNETLQKQNDTPKRKSLSKSPSSSKKRKIFDNCFTYLQPLSTNRYHVDDELKRDKRLYKKIAYVDLKNSQDVTVKETPKMRPIIKIKLKPRGKKDKEMQPYVKISKSEEVPKKSAQQKTKRRHSFIEKKEASEETEEKLEETPKSGIDSNVIPKRRVSVYLENIENEEKPEPPPQEDKETEEVEVEVKEPVNEDIVETKLDSPEESEEQVDIDNNGIDKSDSENLEPVPPSEPEQPDILINGQSDNTTETTPEEEKPKELNEDSNLSDSSKSSLQKTPSKSGSSSYGSDSDTNDQKETFKGNSDSDVLNGSERKKKRVTFSDEVNN